MIAIVDTGGANLASIQYALARLGSESLITADAARIREARRVILPGVGAAGSSMARLREAGLVGVLRELEQPVLGICLGMQLLFEYSAEGDTECLGILPGRVERLVGGPGISVPHMGWNQVGGADFYFVHSYACPEGPFVLARAEHGQPIPAIVRSGNFLGFQFHPERSGAAGAKLLEDFLA